MKILQMVENVEDMAERDWYCTSLPGRHWRRVDDDRKQHDRQKWTGLIWLRIETGGGLL
jgi:hypothetical protein